MASVGKSINNINNVVYNFDQKSFIGQKTQEKSFASPIFYSFPTNTNIFKADTPFYIQFEFKEYKRPTAITPVQVTDVGTIRLPLPSVNLADKLTARYEEESGVFQSALEGIQAAINEQKGSVERTKDLFSSILKGGAEFVDNALKGTLDKGLQLTGLVVNPYLTVLFKTMAYKTHVFSWIFVPENPAEALVLNQIINKFRWHLMPNYVDGTGNLLLGYPDMVKPSIFPQGYQYDFKYCVLTDMSVNYVPGDTPAFQAKDRAPVAIQLSISLKEIELWTKADLVSPDYKS
jgi:hypothetical protein